MATIQEIKTKLLNANALGRTNLSEKGVKLPDTATTYNIMQAIAEIVGSSGSGGATYTSIVYNTDNTITLTDKDGAVHTMSCTYDGSKLIGVTYDGKAVDLTYNGDALVKVGKTAIDVGNAPANIGGLDHTVTFTVDGEPYEIVSVKNGNSVNAPQTIPTKNGSVFGGWLNADSEIIIFPCVPTTEVVLNAPFFDIPTDYILYVPLKQESATAETGQELVKTGTDYTFQTVDNVPCIKFNNSYMVAYTNALKNKDYTLSAWGKLDSVASNNVNMYGIGAYKNSSTPFTTVGVERNRKTWFIWENLSQSDKYSTISPTQWHHLLLTYKNGTLTLYIDGKAEVSFNAPQNFTSENEEIQIGKTYTNSSTYSFGGYMSAFRVYDRALTEEEITLLSQEFKPTDR